MEAVDGPTSSDFMHHFRLAQQDVHKGVVSSRSNAATGHWKIWEEFCNELDMDPTLQNVEDPIPFLQVFAYRYRNGIISPSRSVVKSRTVEDALRSVGQTAAILGAKDFRLNSVGKTDFRLQRMLSAYHKQDPPPNRVKPIPVQLIRHIMAVAAASSDVQTKATGDMICLAFFFLLRPGEYTGTKSDSTPFCMCDVGIYVGDQRCNPLTTPTQTLSNATFVTLEFTTQKNGVRGEVMGLGRSGDPHLCPVLAIIRRIQHLRAHAASATTPLATFWTEHTTLRPITPKDITEALRLATTVLGPHLGFLAQDISARSLRASGAMALLCGHVDTDIIRLLGRWRSDEMLRYLHIQAAPVMKDFAATMLRGGQFTLHPNHAVPTL